MNLSGVSQIKSLLERHGFVFSKSLGQNFLINSRITEGIAESSGADKNTAVLEIGPGIGCLTQELALRAAEVFAVEIDSRLIPVLEETVGWRDNVRIINEDILKFDLSSLPGGMPVSVCANLPYYITTPVIMKLLQSRMFCSVTVMVQKEVAERLCAGPGSKEYGAITAAVRYYSEPELLFRVSAGNFIPAPKVDSAVIRLIPVPPRCGAETESVMFRLIRAGFGQRRKTLLNALSSDPLISRAQAAEALDAAGIRAESRAETLGVGDFIALAEAFERLR